MNVVQRLCERLSAPAGPVWLAVIGVALCLPSLWVGLQADDYYIRATITDTHPYPGIQPSRWEPYTYLTGDVERAHVLMDRGYMPWWTDPACKASFARPLTVLTMMFDYAAWPDSPMLMHAHSLLWYGLLVGVTAVLYRRILVSGPAAWVATLAGLLYAIDDAHGFAAGWLANRNSILAATLGALCIITFDGWRRERSALGAVAAPALFLLALLAKEEAISTAAYLFAYVVFLDRGPVRSRVLALLPCAIVAAGWYAGYQALGYGADASDMYVDPGGHPARFLWRVVRYGPILLLGQLGAPPSDVSAALSVTGLAIHWALAAGFLAMVAAIAGALLRRSATARFFAVGMVLSVVPVCAVFSSDRLLIFVGIGASGLVAELLVRLKTNPDWWSRTGRVPRRVRVVGGVLFALHVVLAPILLPVQAISAKSIGGMMEVVWRSMPDDDAVSEQSVVFVNTFCSIADVAMLEYGHAKGLPIPQRCLNLNAAATPAEITRVDDRTIVVRPLGGYLQARGRSPGIDGAAPIASLDYVGRMVEHVVRAAERPMRLGERVELTAAAVVVTALTDDGRPAEATFTFRESADSPRYRWLMLRPDEYIEVRPPAGGETVRAPSPYEKGAKFARVATPASGDPGTE
jgi:hypothetical protein